MVVEQVEQKTVNEVAPSENLIWSSAKSHNQDRSSDASVSIKNEALQTKFKGLIHRDQDVFVTGDQKVGRIIKFLPGIDGRIDHIAIRSLHFWGHPKILSLEFVSDVNSKGVWLSVDRGKFQGLPDYKTDTSTLNEIEMAIWNDQVLRIIDFHEIDVQVKNGVVSLNGHLSGIENEKRVESAIGSITGILGVRNHLVMDDDLLNKVAEALIPIDQVEGNHVFAKVENGVAGLSGNVVSIQARDLAEQYAANVPSIRGVINGIAAPGIVLDPEEQRFLQPTIGEKIFFHDGLFGFIRQVVINRDNRRVVGMIIQGRFPAQLGASASTTTSDETRAPDRLVVIPVSVIRYLTSTSGFLFIDSSETTRYEDFDPANFVDPDADWIPPYPYFSDAVRFYGPAQPMG